MCSFAKFLENFSFKTHEGKKIREFFCALVCINDRVINSYQMTPEDEETTPSTTGDYMGRKINLKKILFTKKRKSFWTAKQNF